MPLFHAYAPDWFQRSLDSISNITGRSMLTEVPYELFPADLTPGIHFDIAFEADPRQGDKAKFILDVFDGTKIVATFSQNGIYFDPNIDQRTGREMRLNTEWFARNTVEMLLHHNVWSMFAPQAALQFPENDLRKFISSVLQRQEST